MMHLQTPALLPAAPPIPAAPPSAVAVTIQDGELGTIQTVAAMRSLIYDGKKDATVHELASGIVRRACVPAYDFGGEARAIYEAVRRNVRFTRDVRGMETLQTAPETIRRRQGDCDDFTVLLCSLLESLGHKTRIVTVGTDEEDPETFTHVYPEVFLAHKWVAVDAARRHPRFGKGVSRYARKRIWSTDSGEWKDVAGLGAYIPGPVPNFTVRAPRRLASGRFTMGEYILPAGALGPRVRSNPRAPYGEGNYGARALAGLAQDDSEAEQLTSELPQLTVGVSDIITASRAAPTNLFPTTNPITGGSAVSVSSLELESYLPYLLLGGLLIGAVVILRNR